MSALDDLREWVAHEPRDGARGDILLALIELIQMVEWAPGKLVSYDLDMLAKMLLAARRAIAAGVPADDVCERMARSGVKALRELRAESSR